MEVDRVLLQVSPTAVVSYPGLQVAILRHHQHLPMRMQGFTSGSFAYPYMGREQEASLASIARPELVACSTMLSVISYRRAALEGMVSMHLPRKEQMKGLDGRKRQDRRSS